MPEPRSPWRAFSVLAIAVFLAVLDLFIVNIAFPDIRRSFSSASLSSLSWILSGYAIVVAAVLVPAGKLADIVGRKRVFLTGLLIFLAGSALAAAAPSVDFLIGARVIQAVGGAAVTPTSLGLILPLFPPAKRATVIGLWAGFAGVGAAVGPPIGGLLVEASWRWLFLINLPLGLVKGADWSWDGRSLAAFAASALLLVLFTLRSARHPAPVLELPLLRPPAFALSSLAALLFFAAFAVLLLGNVLFLTRLDDQPHYLSQYLPGTLLGGLGVGLILPAITALAASTLPPARLATGIGVQTTFRQIGAAVGLASFVAIVGSSTLATKSDFNGNWLFMAIASASAGLALAPLLRHTPHAATVEAPAPVLVIRD